MNNPQIVSSGDNKYSGAYCIRRKGKKKEFGEDAVLAKTSGDGKFSLLAVADGVGSDFKGEIGSQTVLMLLKKWFWDDNLNLLNRLDKMEDSDIIKELKKISADFIDDVSKTLKNKAKLDPEAQGKKRFYSTTIAVVLVIGNRIFHSWLGDSRIYFFYKGRIFLLSYDHSIDIFPDINDLVNFERNLQSNRALNVIYKSYMSQGGGILKFLAGHIKELPNMIWYNSKKMFHNIYALEKDFNDIFFDHIFLTTDGLESLYIWYLEENLISYMINIEKPYDICKDFLDRNYETSFDDTGIVLWNNPKFKFFYHFGIPVIYRIFGNLRNFLAQDDLYANWETIRKKAEIGKDTDDCYKSFVRNCQIKPLKDQFKIAFETNFSNIISVTSNIRYLNISLGNKFIQNEGWNFQNIQLEKLDSKIIEKNSRFKIEEGKIILDYSRDQNIIEFYYESNNNKMEIKFKAKNSKIILIRMKNSSLKENYKYGIIENGEENKNILDLGKFDLNKSDAIVLISRRVNDFCDNIQEMIQLYRNKKIQNKIKEDFNKQKHDNNLNENQISRNKIKISQPNKILYLNNDEEINFEKNVTNSDFILEFEQLSLSNLESPLNYKISFHPIYNSYFIIAKKINNFKYEIHNTISFY